MTAALTPVPKIQFFADDGTPLVGGKLYTYAAGTTTPLATYTTYAGNVANTNPVILDSRGEANVWLGIGPYKLALYDSVNALIWTVDNITPEGDASLVTYLPAGTGAVVTTAQAKLRESVSVKDFGAVGDGVADDTAEVQAAVTYCNSIGDHLYWPDGTYLTSASISNFHVIKHTGAGIVRRSGVDWPITPNRDSVRFIYVSPSGNDANDGLTSAQPRLTIQGCVDAVNKWGPIIGRQQIIGAAGTYAEKVDIPDGLAQENYYLEFKFPSVATVRGDPSAWPAGGAILDGTGLTGDGFTVGRYNKVYVEYLLIRDWFDPAVAATSQVVSGLTVGAFSFLFTYGVSYSGNGWNNLYVQPDGYGFVTGGIVDGARYGFNNTGGRLSMSAGVTTYTTIKNALEYGIYAKHNSSTVIDYAEFLDNGQNALAAAYGAALFSYKSGTSIDTRNCTFKRNNIVYNSRSGGHIATEIPSTDVLGTGADVNDRVWQIKGLGNDDAINYKSLGPRDLTQQFSTASTASATTVTIIDNIVTLPATYFQSTDQYFEIEIYGAANTGTATVRPTWTSNAPTNYGFGVFTVAANTRFKIRLLIYPTGLASQFIIFDNVGATSGGATSGTTTSTGVFGTLPMTFKVRGEITAGTLDIDRVRVVLWG
jgi:hypothetical protein